MRYYVLPLFALTLPLAACKEPPKPLASRARTFAELRTVRRGVTVTLPGDKSR